MSDIPAFTSFAPGFEFLQGLVKNAGSALPGIGQWVAPTLNPEELDKRIQELRTVQFWLEQNARMLGATIQALEVQKMTLTTLQTMNVQMSDLRDSLTIRMPVTPSAASATVPPDESEAPDPDRPAAAEGTETQADTAARTDPKPAVDPMQWWGALTKQFSELAASALKEGAAGTAPGTHQPPTAASTKPKSPPRKAAAKKAASRSSASTAPARKTRSR
jgi:hypothetical protein